MDGSYLGKIFNSKILEARKISSDIKYIKFSVPGEFEFTPGQYLSVSRISDGKKLRTPYSIASSPGKGFAEFFIRIIDVGKASSYMGNLKKGDEIELFGPAGKFVIEESSKRKDLFFISNGTGITAFLSMISSVLEEGFGKKIILLAGFRNENEILCEKRLINLGKKFPNLEIHNVLSKPENGDYADVGYVQDFLEKHLPKNFKGDFYLCGLKGMIDEIKAKLAKKGVKEERIFYEKYN